MGREFEVRIPKFLASGSGGGHQGGALREGPVPHGADNRRQGGSPGPGLPFRLSGFSLRPYLSFLICRA